MELSKLLHDDLDEAAGGIITRGVHGDLAEAPEQPNLPFQQQRPHLCLHPAVRFRQIGGVPDFLPPPGRANVIVVDPSRIGEARVSACLVDAEQTQAARFRFEKDARHWRACRAALRSVLGRALQAEPASLIFRFGEHGKPHLAPPHHELHFNLSHCHDLALVALSRSGPVGIDLEAADRGSSLLGCEASFCHPEEIATLPSSPDARSAALLDLWTSKEALLKALGTGMSLAPDSVSLRGPGGHLGHPLLRNFLLHAVEHPALRHHVARLASPHELAEVEVGEFAG